MQTLGYLWAIMRHPRRWRDLYGLLWMNTIPGRWLWYLGACLGLWHEYASDRDWAQRHYGNSMWRFLWWVSDSAVNDGA